MAMTSPPIYVQYGCGLSAPPAWQNYDASPTLRVQRLPLVGRLLTRGRVRFPANVRYGDVTRRLPVADGVCAGVYASHVLEHLAYEDLARALSETARILRQGGIFRLVVPCLERAARRYVAALDSGEAEAGNRFLRETLLGLERRPRGLRAALHGFRMCHHLWMWDYLGLTEQLRAAGFDNIRRAGLNDCEDPMFEQVEDPERLRDALTIEARRV